MTKPIKKIGLFLIIISLLPVIFFTFREVSSLNENEKVIEQIYNNQLESILFSVNQFSDDVIRRWAVKIEIALEEGKNDKKIVSEKLKSIFDDNGSINNIVITDSSFSPQMVLSPKQKTETENTFAVLHVNKKNIIRLYQLKKSSYMKIESLSDSINHSAQILVFVVGENKICSISIDKKLFINLNLSSKIKTIAGNEFNVAVFDSSSNGFIYTAGKFGKDEVQHKKNLWLVPNYSLVISSRGQTIESLVKERTITGIYFIAGLGLFMLIVAWLGYINIKKQIDLAQIKSEFVSNVSHELRTPLALINMFTETLSMGRIKSEEKRDEYYKIIHLETERLSKIVNKILNFSKIENGKWKYNFQTADLNSVVEQIYGSYKYHLEQNGFEFLFNPAAGVLNTMIDAEAVSEAIINLIDNGVKYSAGKKYISVNTGREDEYVYVEVEDYGTGITNEEQNKIFEKFYRAKSNNVHNTKGTGLGLALVKLIVEANKGKIKLTSEVGKGSIFRLLFLSDKNN